MGLLRLPRYSKVKEKYCPHDSTALLADGVTPEWRIVFVPRITDPRPTCSFATISVVLGFQLSDAVTLQLLWHLADHSSSPKKTLIGIHESLTTLKRVWMPFKASISSLVNSQPSNWKFCSILEGVTLFGMMLVPLCRPHINLGLLVTPCALLDGKDLQDLRWALALGFGNLRQSRLLVKRVVCGSPKARVGGAVDTL